MQFPFILSLSLSLPLNLSFGRCHVCVRCSACFILHLLGSFILVHGDNLLLLLFFAFRVRDGKRSSLHSWPSPLSKRFWVYSFWLCSSFFVRHRDKLFVYDSQMYMFLLRLVFTRSNQKEREKKMERMVAHF